jgi:hypothetical protein
MLGDIAARCQKNSNIRETAFSDERLGHVRINMGVSIDSRVAGTQPAIKIADRMILFLRNWTYKIRNKSKKKRDDRPKHRSLTRYHCATGANNNIVPLPAGVEPATFR